MPKEIYPIPGTQKKMVVEKDNAGHLISVKDDEGKPAQKVDLKEGTITVRCGAIEAAVIEVPDGTTFATKHNPTCRWYFICGNWYYICWG